MIKQKVNMKYRSNKEVKDIWGESHYTLKEKCA